MRNSRVRSLKVTARASVQVSGLFLHLRAWVDRGWIRPVDLALAEFFHARVQGLSARAVLASVLVSHQLGRGHTCLDLQHLAQNPFAVLDLQPQYGLLQDAQPQSSDMQQDPWGLLQASRPEDWLFDLKSVPDLVSVAPSDLSDAVCRPLVLAEERLYLYRYWRCEHDVRRAIQARLTQTTFIDDGAAAMLFRQTLQDLFPNAPDLDLEHTVNWQKIACALAARGTFMIITGGPGTGKTTTVVRLLALLQTLRLQPDQALDQLQGGTITPLRIALAAPTGKAAARLRAAILGARDQLPASIQSHPAVFDSIPTEVTTVHRLLGTGFDSRRFRYDQFHRLPIDLLVIDEASMIDLEMMAAVLRALPPSARLVLLGDKDQLSSVEAGAVLGQLCAHAAQGGFRPATADWVLEMTGEALPAVFVHPNGRPVDQQVVMLRQSHRFTQGSGIGQLAAAIHSGEPDRLIGVLSQGYKDVKAHELTGPMHQVLRAVLADLVEFMRALQSQRPAIDAPLEGYAQWAQRVLKVRGQFQILCGTRQGPLGVEQFNLALENLLAAEGYIHRAGGWYEGRPILVTRNDYQLGLMNGDMGVALMTAVEHPVTRQRSQGLRVAFPREEDGAVRWVSPSRLSSVETVYAMTVHKSQGSEFDHCFVVLPEQGHPALTRELVYTAVTRAKRQVSLASRGAVGQVLIDAMGRVTQRAGGLSEWSDKVEV